MKNEPARRRLARIRCLFDTINCIVKGKSLPPPLCFVASEVEFAVVDGSIETLPVFKKPSKNAEKIAEIASSTKVSLLASGDEYVNDEGAWLRLSQVCKYFEVYNSWNHYHDSFELEGALLSIWHIIKRNVTLCVGYAYIRKGKIFKLNVSCILGGSVYVFSSVALYKPWSGSSDLRYKIPNSLGGKLNLKRRTTRFSWE